MKKLFFFKNTLLFVVPLLVPVTILGSLAIYITQQYMQSEINKNQLLLFNQIDRNIEQMFYDMDSLDVSLGNSDASYRLEAMMLTQSLALEDLRVMKMIQNYLNTPATVKPYVESVYVYVENDYNQFLVDGEGLVRLDGFHDTAWLDSYRQNKRQRGVWTESRFIRHYSFTPPVQVTTLYKNLYSTIQNRANGVIVMNVYTEYMENVLSNMTLLPDQQIVVVDEQGRTVFRNASAAKQNPTGEVTGTAWNWDGTGYAVSRSPAAAVSGWEYISITPQRSLQQIPFKLSYMTSFFVLLSLAIGLALSYLLARRSTRQVRNMISILQHAERGIPLPAISASGSGDAYGIITEKIVKNFIEQHYLRVQLSEKKYKLQTAELLALQAQINPHFVHNTLQTIYWKVLSLTGKPNDANRMMESLSNLLKYSLEKPQETVPVEREIRNARHYIDIQKVRYRDQITVLWQYDQEELEGADCIKLLLQPIIENSIHHGLRDQIQPVHIKIKLQRLPDVLRIAVVDNGRGMSRERLREIRELIRNQDDSYSHIGLVNTGKRIALNYGGTYGLIVRSKLGFGTSVTMHIPQGKREFSDGPASIAAFGWLP